MPQTHGMMAGVIAGHGGACAADEADPNEVPQSLEWMPWSHISAGNIGFNGVLWAGGTVHLDEGKPIPGMFETTIKNLYEVSPIVFGSAPIAFSMLAEASGGGPETARLLLQEPALHGLRQAPRSPTTSMRRMQALAIASRDGPSHSPHHHVWRDGDAGDHRGALADRAVWVWWACRFRHNPEARAERLQV